MKKLIVTLFLTASISFANMHINHLPQNITAISNQIDLLSKNMKSKVVIVKDTKEFPLVHKLTPDGMIILINLFSKEFNDISIKELREIVKVYGNKENINRIEVAFPNKP